MSALTRSPWRYATTAGRWSWTSTSGCIPGTPAAAYGGSVPPPERSARARAISEKGEFNRYEYARRFYGKTVEIVVEGEDGCYGRTDEYLWCRATGNAPRKSLARVVVTKTHHDGTLEGTIR